MLRVEQEFVLLADIDLPVIGQILHDHVELHVGRTFLGHQPVENILVGGKILAARLPVGIFREAVHRDRTLVLGIGERLGQRLEIVRLQHDRSRIIRILREDVFEVDALHADLVDLVDVFVAVLVRSSVPLFAIPDHGQADAAFRTDVEFVGRNQHPQRQHLRRTGLRNGEHHRHVGPVLGRMLFVDPTVHLRAHPCGRETLGLDGDDLDLALQASLLHQQRPFQFFVVAQRQQSDGDRPLSHAVLVDMEIVPDSRTGDPVAVQPGDLRPVGRFVQTSAALRLHGVAQEVAPSVDLSPGVVQHMVGFLHRQDIILVLHLVHLVRNGDPDVVGGRRGQRLLERSLPEGERTVDMQFVVMIAADEYLIPLLVEQHHPVVEVVRSGLPGRVSADDHAHGVFGSVLALEDILVAGGPHVHDIAHLGVVQRERDERIVLPGPLEVEPFGRMERRDRSEGIRIAGHESRHLQPLVRPVVDGDPRMVADHPDGIALFRHLRVDPALVGRIAGETGPVDHHAGTALQDGHHLRLGLVAEIVLREFRHILVGHEMNRPGVFGHIGREGARLRARGAELLRRHGRDEQPVCVEAEERHVLHAVSVGVDRTGRNLLHGRNVGIEPERHVAFACRRQRIRQVILSARDRQDSHSGQGYCRMHHSSYHSPILLSVPLN